MQFYFSLKTQFEGRSLKASFVIAIFCHGAILLSKALHHPELDVPGLTG